MLSMLGGDLAVVGRRVVSDGDWRLGGWLLFTLAWSGGGGMGSAAAVAIAARVRRVVFMATDSG